MGYERSEAANILPVRYRRDMHEPGERVFTCIYARVRLDTMSNGMLDALDIFPAKRAGGLLLVLLLK